MGNGALIVGGGTIGVLVFLGAAVGGSVGIEGYSALDMVGMGPLTGFISAYANTREMAPMIAAIGFAAQAGTRMTAEIGAMRIGEEIDALEAQAIPSIPFVVTTRVLAGMITIIPLYLLTLVLSYLSCALVVNVVHGQSSGTYYHYFDSFIQPSDVAFSLVKAVVFVTLIIAIHGYQGYYASGGPEGVGQASPGDPRQPDRDRAQRHGVDAAVLGRQPGNPDFRIAMPPLLMSTAAAPAARPCGSKA